MVIGWREGRLILVSKQNVQESLVFSKFEPTIPLKGDEEFPLLLSGNYEGKGLRLNGDYNQQKNLHGQNLELCEAKDAVKVFKD